MSKNKIIVLTGPTAVGKTSLSIKLAKAINGEIISADSMQVYRGMDIGSAKIMPEEMEGVKHYLVDVLEPTDEFNVFVFKQMAMEALSEIYAKGKIPIIVGGTGFYIQALLYDINFEVEDNTQIRSALEMKAAQIGPEALYEELKSRDPEYASTLHYNNVKKVIRALEYIALNGKKFSEHNEEERQKESPYDFRYFVLNDVRQNLYDRIDLRVDLMMKNGLLEEVKNLYDKGYTRSLNSMQGLGYKELLDYFDGLCTLDEAVEKIKLESRHFAKRQLTWFRRERDVIWVQKDKFEYDDEQIIDFMLGEINRD